jgi:glutaredoxin 3
MSMKKVEIYSTPTCTYCQAAKKFFADNGVEYTEYDVSTDEAKRTEMIDKSGQMGVPVIVVDGEMLVGYDEGKLKEQLGL